MILSNGDESIVKWECTLFFQNNPLTLETAFGIATRIGREEEFIKKTLNQLVDVTILEKIGDPNNPIYRYRHPFVANKIDLD